MSTETKPWKEGDKVIDLRNEEDSKAKPVAGSENIPYQQAWNDFLDWDEDVEYFVFCNTGQNSSMLKRFMEEQGYKVEQLEGGVEAHPEIVST